MTRAQQTQTWCTAWDFPPAGTTLSCWSWQTWVWRPCLGGSAACSALCRFCLDRNRKCCRFCLDRNRKCCRFCLDRNRKCCWFCLDRNRKCCRFCLDRNRKCCRFCLDRNRKCCRFCLDRNRKCCQHRVTAAVRFSCCCSCSSQVFSTAELFEVHLVYNNRLFMVPHLVRAQSAYKGIRICSFITHTHTHKHTHTNTKG